MAKDFKIGESVFYVNMTYFYKWNGFFTCDHPLKDKESTLILKIKVEKVSNDSDGWLWINSNLRGKYAFKTEREAKDFIIGEAKKDDLKYEQEMSEIKTRIRDNDKMSLKAKND